MRCSRLLACIAVCLAFLSPASSTVGIRHFLCSVTPLSALGGPHQTTAGANSRPVSEWFAADCGDAASAGAVCTANVQTYSMSEDCAGTWAANDVQVFVVNASTAVEPGLSATAATHELHPATDHVASFDLPPLTFALEHNTQLRLAIAYQRSHDCSSPAGVDVVYVACTADGTELGVSLESSTAGASTNAVHYARMLAGRMLAGSLISGPYTQSVGQSSALVVWRTAVASVGTVKLGTSASSLSKVFTTSGSAKVDAVVTVTGLKAATKYFYSVSDSGGILATGSFKTLPKLGSSSSLRLLLLGDPGTGRPIVTSVISAARSFMGSSAPQAIFLLGDNAYDDGTDKEYTENVFAPYQKDFAAAAMYAVIGNHDDSSSVSSKGVGTGPYFNRFITPKKAEGGGKASGAGAYYSLDFGQVHIVCLDSFMSDLSASGAQATWLKSDLAALKSTTKWLVAIWHHPPYSQGGVNSDSEGFAIAMRTNFLPMLEAAGLDMLIGGHSHNYERSQLVNGFYGKAATFTSSNLVGTGLGTSAKPYIKPAGLTANTGMISVVAGSSGKVDGSSSGLMHPANAFIGSGGKRGILSAGSVILDISGTVLTGTFVSDSGKVIDTFAISKSSVIKSSASGSALPLPTPSRSPSKNLQAPSTSSAASVSPSSSSMPSRTRTTSLTPSSTRSVSLSPSASPSPASASPSISLGASASSSFSFLPSSSPTVSGSPTASESLPASDSPTPLPSATTIPGASLTPSPAPGASTTPSPSGAEPAAPSASSTATPLTVTSQPPPGVSASKSVSATPRPSHSRSPSETPDGDNTVVLSHTGMLSQSDKYMISGIVVIGAAVAVAMLVAHRRIVAARRGALLKSPKAKPALALHHSISSVDRSGSRGEGTLPLHASTSTGHVHDVTRSPQAGTPSLASRSSAGSSSRLVLSPRPPSSSQHSSVHSSSRYEVTQQPVLEQSVDVVVPQQSISAQLAHPLTSANMNPRVSRKRQSKRHLQQQRTASTADTGRSLVADSESSARSLPSQSQDTPRHPRGRRDSASSMGAVYDGGVPGERYAQVSKPPTSALASQHRRVASNSPRRVLPHGLDAVASARGQIAGLQSRSRSSTRGPTASPPGPLSLSAVRRRHALLKAAAAVLLKGSGSGTRQLSRVPLRQPTLQLPATLLAPQFTLPLAMLPQSASAAAVAIAAVPYIPVHQSPAHAFDPINGAPIYPTATPVSVPGYWVRVPVSHPATAPPSIPSLLHSRTGSASGNSFDTRPPSSATAASAMPVDLTVVSYAQASANAARKGRTSASGRRAAAGV